MKKILFSPKSLRSEVLVERPEPSKNFIPDWFKKIPSFENGEIKINNFGRANKTIKMCYPFSDCFNMGYIQKTWCDIYIERDGDAIKYKYPSSPVIMSHREKTSYPIPEEFYQTEFLWKLEWSPQLPKGYSLLYTHPLNRIDLPFYSLSGIVDADKFKYEKNGNHPFFIKKGFSGLIPAGTPFIQMIPFKRDEWQSDFLEFNEREQLESERVFKNFWGSYKKKYWSKKIFK
jgi:hypothetical protein